MGRRTSRRKSTSYSDLIYYGLLIGTLGYSLAQMDTHISWGIPALLVFLTFALILAVRWIRVRAEKRDRLTYLFSRYDTYEAHKILRKIIWVGETSEQLLDSLGKPYATDDKLMKTKHRRVWKYRHQGGNRFALRITVDDDAVSAWDDKGN